MEQITYFDLAKCCYMAHSANTDPGELILGSVAVTISQSKTKSTNAHVWRNHNHSLSIMTRPGTIHDIFILPNSS